MAEIKLNLDSLPDAPEHKKSLWQRLNEVPESLQDQTKDLPPNDPNRLRHEAFKHRDEEFIKNHPYVGGAMNFIKDTAKQSLFSPLGAALSVGSLGSSTLARAGVTQLPERAMHAINTLMSGGALAHGGYRAVTADTPQEKVAGAGEAVIGALGLRGGGKSGGSTPTDPFPEFKGPKGAKEAYTFLDSQPSGSPADAKTLAAHKAVDAYTLLNRDSELAQEISGPHGRPEKPTYDPKITKGLRIASKPLDKVSAATVKRTADEMNDRQIAQQSKASEQQWGQVARNENARQRAIETGEKRKQKYYDDLRKARGQADAEQARRDAVGSKQVEKDAVQEARNLNARDKFIEKDQTQEARNLNARDKYIEKDQTQTARNLNSKDKYVQGQQAQDARNLNAKDRFIEKDQVQTARNLNTQEKYVAGVEKAENAKTAAELKQREAGWQQEAKNLNEREKAQKAQEQAATLEALKKTLTEEVPPSSISETVSGPGEYGGTQRATIRRVAPKPPEKGEGGGEPPSGGAPPDDGNFDVFPKKYGSKAKAQTIAEHLGGTIHQDGPRQYSIRLPKSNGTPAELPPAPETPLQLWDKGGPPPPYKSSTPLVQSEPTAPNGNGSFARAKAAGLTPEEFNHYMELAPKKGTNLTPDQLAEYKALHARINGGGEPPAPTTPAPKPKGPKPTSPATTGKAAKNAEITANNPLDSYQDSRYAGDLAGDLGPEGEVPKNSVAEAGLPGTPFVNPVGEVEPTLPGVKPANNPTPQVAEAPFALSPQSTPTPKPAPQPDLLADPNSSRPRIFDENMAPIEKAGEQYGMMRDLKKKGLATEEGRRDAAMGAQQATQDFAATDPSLDDISKLPEEYHNPLLRELVKRAKHLGKSETGSLVIERRPGDYSFGNGNYLNEDAIKSGLSRLGTEVNNFRRGGLLSPISTTKKLISDAQSLGLGAYRHPERAGDILHNTFHPETLREFKAGWDAPAPGMSDEGAGSSFFYNPWNPLGWNGRTMSGFTQATKGILERSGFSGDEAAKLTLTSPPSRAFTGALYELSQKPVFNHLTPFARTASNWLEQGWEHSPFDVPVQAWQHGMKSPEVMEALKKAALGTAVGGAAYAATPENFVKEHPIYSSVLTGGVLGAPALVGMTLKARNSQPIAKTVGTLIRELPGAKMADDALAIGEKGLTAPLSGYIGSYTNLPRPLAEYLDPNERVTRDKNASLIQQLLMPTQSHIPGLREQLPIKAGPSSGIDPMTDWLMQQRQQ